MGLTIEYSGPIKIKYFYDGYGAHEMIDIINETKPLKERCLAFAYRGNEEAKWTVNFASDKIETSDGFIKWHHYKENGKTKFFFDYIKAVQFMLDKLFIDSL